MTNPPGPSCIRFAQFELRPQQRLLLAHGEPVAIGARAFDLLLVLVERPGALVHKQELLERVWPRQVVEEGNIPVQINALRKVLGKDVIGTVPGRGYRFTAVVDGVDHALGTATAAVRHADARPSAGQGDEATPFVRTDGHAAAFDTNLPGSLTRMLGRKAELDALDDLVGSHRLVTLVGVGGVGKSLLAQHLLLARQSAHRHGVCWAELAPARNVDEALGFIGAAVGVTPGGGRALQALGDALAPLHLLLALDNAEHLMPEIATAVAHLLGAAPDLRVLVTSQSPLGLPAECLMRLGTLSLPGPNASVDEALEHGAVALFVELARSADVHFRLTRLNLAAVTALCRALDGLPLAIQLAASRVRALGLAGIEASMRNRFRLLAANRDPGAPPRHQTLRTALEWSHALLSAVERCVFRRLAVLSGTTSLDLLVKIVVHPGDDSGIDEWTAQDALCALVDRCLVEVVGSDALQPRYRLLESLRALADEHLRASGEHEAACRRHAHVMADHFDAMLTRRVDGSMGLDEWTSAVLLDMANGRAALAWCVAQGACEQLNAVRVCLPMLRVLIQGSWDERMALADRVEQLLQAGLPPRMEIKAIIALRWAWASARRQVPGEWLTKACGMARQIAADSADPQDLMLWCLALCAVVRQEPDRSAAPGYQQELEVLARRSWPPQVKLMIAETRYFVLTREGGDPAAIKSAAEAMVALATEAGWGSVQALNARLDSQLAVEDFVGAEQTGRRLLDALRFTRREYELAYMAVNLLAAAVGLENVAQARAIAFDFWHRVVRFELQPYFCSHMALMCALQGRHAAAMAIVGFAEEHHRRRQQMLQINEARSHARAWDLACAALGEPAAQAARASGVGLHDADVAALAFAEDTRPAPRAALAH